jgi:hypothetical protein
VGTIARCETQWDNPSAFHINIYAKVEDTACMLGYRLVLMTQDHIFPHSLGGSNTLDNLQTMCHDCNFKKQDSIAIKTIFSLSDSAKRTNHRLLTEKNSMIKTLVLLIMSVSDNLNESQKEILGNLTITRDLSESQFEDIVSKLYELKLFSFCKRLERKLSTALLFFSSLINCFETFM